MKDANHQFVEEMANPHLWLMTADDLHTQAVATYGQQGRSFMTRTAAEGAAVTWNGVNRLVFLLGGFALENALKSFLVFENPHWISNGRLAANLRSHRLTSLQEQSKLVPFRRKYRWVLEQFEEGLESWARYPCGLTATESRNHRIMQKRVWNGYLALMEAYGKRLTLLLSKQWNGPHGFRGRWTFQGEFLSRSP
jgi:hypothetical protein